jgi:uncharacterized protein (DUF433 family)
MMTVEPMTHILLDERGMAWIDDTNTKVIEVVMEWLAHRSSAEEIQHQHPHLSLAQVHAAMAYYYDHQPELDQQVERSCQFADRMQTGSTDQPVRSTLEARLNGS